MTCLSCGKPLQIKEKVKPKKYCSNICRMRAFYVRRKGIPIKTKEDKKLFVEFLTSDMNMEKLTKELSKVDKLKNFRTRK